jgi:probable F420-dependent oxidoreductase
MEFGVTFLQRQIGPDPDELISYARTIEEAGFSYVTIGDHILSPDLDPPDNALDIGKYTSNTRNPFHEPLLLYSFLAALTSSLEFVTGLVVLPQRQTVLLAKQATELDILSRGRLRLGVGIGWYKPEFDVLNSDFRSRGRRFEEQIDVLRMLFTQESVTFSGDFHHLTGTGLCPMPVQQPIPIWLGGRLAARALERVGRKADGWLVNLPPGDDLDAAMRIVRQAARSAGRDPGDLGMQKALRIGRTLDVDHLSAEIAEWRRLGATHISIDVGDFSREFSEHLGLVRKLGKLVESLA